MMKAGLQSAYVLHRRNYRDSSLIVDLLTRDQGRISVVAKGVRSTQKRRSSYALLQPFIPVMTSFYGRGQLQSLAKLEPNGRAALLQGAGLYSGIYVNELLMRLLHSGEPVPEVYDLYAKTLPLLEDNHFLDISLRHFEFSLLDQLGYGVSLQFDAASNAQIQADRQYIFIADQGLFEVTDTYSHQQQFCGEDVLDFLKGNYTKSARLAIKQIARLALAPHIGAKPLNSRALFLSK